MLWKPTIPLLLRPSRVSSSGRRVLAATRAILSVPRTPRQAFSSALRPSPLLRSKHATNFPPRPKPPPEDEIEEAFLKGSGAGGQKINKTNSAVQLKHLPTGIVVKSQATRSRSQNRTIARQLLADRLDRIARGDESRSAVVGEVKRKRKASSAKKSRRKYRRLDGERAEPGSHETGTLEDSQGDGLEEQHASANDPYRRP
ncbi:RF-1 domain-containing protein [Hypoxylon sp. FL1284]|nr:RF-1 domain-containing protein [Hypoxylon sp. FL1284]